jgi:hypothetical protein
VVLWEIYTKEHVDIPIDEDHAVFFRVEDQEEYAKYIELMRSCLRVEPDKRPSLSEIIDTLETLGRQAKWNMVSVDNTEEMVRDQELVLL